MEKLPQKSSFFGVSVKVTDDVFALIKNGKKTFRERKKERNRRFSRETQKNE